MRLEAEVRIKDQEGAGEKVRRWSAGGRAGGWWEMKWGYRKLVFSDFLYVRYHCRYKKKFLFYI